MSPSGAFGCVCGCCVPVGSVGGSSGRFVGSGLLRVVRGWARGLGGHCLLAFCQLVLPTQVLGLYLDLLWVAFAVLGWVRLGGACLLFLWGRLRFSSGPAVCAGGGARSGGGGLWFGVYARLRITSSSRTFVQPQFIVCVVLSVAPTSV